VAAGLLALGISVPVLAAGGSGVVVLRSADIAPFMQVQQGFESTVGQPIKAYSVHDARDEALAAAEHAALVLTIGPEASALAEHLRGGAQVIRAMVPGSASEHLVPIYPDPAQQVRSITKLLPRARKLGIVYDPAQSSAVVNDYVAAAETAGLTVVKSRAGSREEVAGAVRTLANSVNALWLVPDTTVVSADTFKFMVQLSLSQKVPLIGFSKGMAKSGALMAIEAGYREMGKRAGEAGKKALAGGSSIPEAAAGTVYLNASSADLLGVTLPDSLKSRAGAVYE